jgi:hypothetical protein
MKNLMRLTISPSIVAVGALLFSLPLAAQTREGVMGDLLNDIGGAEKKILAPAPKETGIAKDYLHEHLGQLIAYARSNKVTPPWSK